MTYVTFSGTWPAKRSPRVQFASNLPSSRRAPSSRTTRPIRVATSQSMACGRGVSRPSLTSRPRTRRPQLISLVLRTRSSSRARSRRRPSPGLPRPKYPLLALRRFYERPVGTRSFSAPQAAGFLASRQMRSEQVGHHQLHLHPGFFCNSTCLHDLCVWNAH